MPTNLNFKSHIQVYDRTDRQLWAQRFGVSEERLRKAVRLVGTRLTTIADYLGRPVPDA